MTHTTAGGGAGTTPAAGTRAAALLEAAEIAGWRDTWEAAPAAIRAEHGFAHRDHGSILLTAVATVPGRLANHAFGLRDDHPAPNDALESIEGFFGPRGLPAQVAVAEGAALEALLAMRGYVRDYAWVKFVRDTAPAAPVECELAIRPVPLPEAARMGRIITGAFGLPAGLDGWHGALVGRPGWYCLGAYDGSKLVATGSLFVLGEFGWVTWGATDAAHRGRRAQRALLAARIDLARELGLRQLVTETGDIAAGHTDASHRNILRAGFRAVYRRPFWRKDPDG